MSALRIDPTRTTMLRRKFMQAASAYFLRLKSAVVDLVEREDSFGLVRNEDWAFLPTQGKLDAFRAWIVAQLAAGVLRPPGDDQEAWYERFLSEGYQRGVKRAYSDVRMDLPGLSQDFKDGAAAQFAASFGAPVDIERIKLLASRTLTDLKNVTAQMAAQMSNALMDGLLRGDSPRKIARRLNERVDVGRSRALTIARTEIIRAHAEGQLSGYEALGVEEIDVMAEWSTAGDSKVCPKCRPMEGVVLKVSEARGLIPFHPNCRCSWIPAGVGESEEGQHRGPDAKRQIEIAVRRDRGKSVWPGRALV